MHFMRQWQRKPEIHEVSSQTPFEFNAIRPSALSISLFDEMLVCESTNDQLTNLC
jgi:hypothetical protein